MQISGLIVASNTVEVLSLRLRFRIEISEADKFSFPNEIVKLRKVGKLEEVLLRMKEIYQNNPENPEYNYQLA